MRRSPFRHPLAVLRVGLGMGQRQMADLLGCSVATVQAIELKRLAMSGRLAQVASDRTSISPEWLLRGDPEAPPVTVAGEPFTPEKYEARQATLQAPEGPQHALLYLDHIIGEWLSWKARAFECLLMGLQQGRPGLVVFKLNQALSAVLKELENRAGGGARDSRSLTRVLDEIQKSKVQALVQIAAAREVPLTAFDLAKGPYAKANAEIEACVAKAAQGCARQLRQEEADPGGWGKADGDPRGRGRPVRSKRRPVKK